MSIFPDVPQSAEKRKQLNLDAGVEDEESSFPHCVKLADREPAALQSDGDVVIGGLFPLHYRLLEPQFNYQSKPQLTACSGLEHRAFRWMMSMVFAVEEINSNSSLLPDVKLGYVIMDTCDHVHTSLQAALSLISHSTMASRKVEQKEDTEKGFDVPKEKKTLDLNRMYNDKESETSPSCVAGCPVPAVIGLASSSPTRAVAQTLGPFDILLDDYSHYGIQAFSDQFSQHGGCVAFHLTIPQSPTAAEIQEMADRLQSSTAHVVVVFAAEVQLLELFSELTRRNVSGIQWLASEAWVTPSLLTSAFFQPLLLGTLGLSFPAVQIPGLKEFLVNVRPSPEPGMEFVNMFWEDMFGCRLQILGDTLNDNVTDPQSFVVEKNTLNYSFHENAKGAAEKPLCTGSEDLRSINNSYTDVSQVRISYNVYKAVYAIAHALHQLLHCDSDKGTCEKNRSFTPQQLLHHLKMVNFTTQFQDKVYFDSNGEPVAYYDIINWQKDSNEEIRFVKVGSYDGASPPGQQLQMEKSSTVWTAGQLQVPVSQCSAPCPPGSRQARRPGQPHCCFDCLPCAEGEISNQTGSTECTKCPEYYWSDKDKVKCVAGVEEYLSFFETMGIILVILTLLGVVLTTTVTTVFHSFRSTPIVKANNSEISFLLLLSLILCYLCCLVFIGQPTVVTCSLRQAAFGISFVLCLSCLLVKTIVVLLAFQANSPRSRAVKLFGPTQQRTLIFCTTAPQICLYAGWLSGAPPFPFKNPTYQASTGKIVVECKESWPPGFYLALSYIGLLAFLCLLLAFLGRKLPDTFNEAKLITFSMLIFWAVWICFIPAYVSSPGKFTVAVEVFAILASSSGLLLCIFIPKCYIILLRPESNIKKGMTGKPPR
ncbi:extracellular calcium-sensing receptor-like [Aulostomus maculatus]